MAEKKEMIKNGDNIELDGVTVINKGINLSKTEEPKVEADVAQSASEESISQNVLNQTPASDIPYGLPEISPVDIPITPVDVPSVVAMSPELPVSQEVESPKFQGFMPTTSNEPVYNYETPTSNTNFLTSGVYKSTNDVDMAEEAFLNDVKAAYDKNIAGPTKTMVNLLNEFKQWGNEVTSQGLNRALFEKFDELSARYDGMNIASYGDNEPDNNYGGMNF